MKEELIRDRIIVGISNVQLSAAMQMNAAIDLAVEKKSADSCPYYAMAMATDAAQVNFVRKGGEPKNFVKPKPNQNVPLSQEKAKKPAGKSPVSTLVQEVRKDA